MREEIDSGDILLQKIKIFKNDDIVSLHKKILIIYKKFAKIFFGNYKYLIQNKKKQKSKIQIYNRKEHQR